MDEFDILELDEEIAQRSAVAFSRLGRFVDTPGELSVAGLLQRIDQARSTVARFADAAIEAHFGGANPLA